MLCLCAAGLPFQVPWANFPGNLLNVYETNNNNNNANFSVGVLCSGKFFCSSLLPCVAAFWSVFQVGDA